MVVLEEDFRLSQRPAVHLETDQEQAAVFTVRDHLLVKGESQEAVALQKVSECESVTETVLSDLDGLQDTGVPELLQDLGRLEFLGLLLLVRLDASHELR